MDAVPPITAPALNPWTRIWTRPRATIRHLVQTDPKRHVAVLAILGGVAQALIQMMDSGAGEELSLPAIFALALTVGPVLGLMALYIGAALLRWSGRWIGGRASGQELRTAVAWANVPMVVVLAAFVLLLPLVGRLPFLDDEALAILPLNVGQAIGMLVLGIAIAVLAVWSFVLLLKGVGEVQGFSAWKAWGNLVLGALPLVALGGLATFVIRLLA